VFDVFLKNLILVGLFKNFIWPPIAMQKQFNNLRTLVGAKGFTRFCEEKN